MRSRPRVWRASGEPATPQARAVAIPKMAEEVSDPSRTNADIALPRNQPPPKQPRATRVVVGSVDEERALVMKARSGDGRAFEALVGPYQRALFNMAYRMVNDREDARDITQTVLLKAYQGLGGFDTQHRFFSWIYRIVINESLNHLKRRRRQEPLDEQMVAGGPSAEDSYARDEASAALQSALMDLRPDHRLLIILRHFLDFSHHEIGEILALPDQRVKSRLHTARDLLAEALEWRAVENA
jgi:RNA polymerase sigma-70 factor (ECF subfamily)